MAILYRIAVWRWDPARNAGLRRRHMARALPSLLCSFTLPRSGPELAGKNNLLVVALTRELFRHIPREGVLLGDSRQVRASASNNLVPRTLEMTLGTSSADAIVEAKVH